MLLRVNRVERIQGQIGVPGDKSISHRALILGSLASEKVEVRNFLAADDCLSTLECLRQLGGSFKHIEDKKTVLIEGVGLEGFKEPVDVLDAGNSGTTMRVLPGLLSGQSFFSVITGDDSLRRRPMLRIVEPLKEMGADIWGRQGGDRAPLAINGRRLKGIAYTTPVPSAQIKTAILVAGLLAEGETSVVEREKSRDHTERMLRFFGAQVEVDGNRSRLLGRGALGGGLIDIPGDLSSAAFFVTAAAILPKSELTLTQVGVNKTRAGILEVLRRMGALIDEENVVTTSEEPRADLVVKPGELKAVAIGADLIPRIIDELPLVAVAATQAAGKTVISGAAELRVKESDRLSSMTRELTKMGARIKEKEDGLEIDGPTPLSGARCESHGDHRVAMALAVAGLRADGATTIEGGECVAVSYPEFEATLETVTTS